MSTLATSLSDLRRAFRVEYFSLNQYMMREGNTALGVAQSAESCLGLAEFSCPCYCCFSIINVYFATQFIFYLRRETREGEKGVMPFFVLSSEEKCIFV